MEKYKKVSTWFFVWLAGQASHVGNAFISDDLASIALATVAVSFSLVGLIGMIVTWILKRKKKAKEKEAREEETLKLLRIQTAQAVGMLPPEPGNKPTAFSSQR